MKAKHGNLALRQIGQDVNMENGGATECRHQAEEALTDMQSKGSASGFSSTLFQLACST